MFHGCGKYYRKKKLQITNCELHFLADDEEKKIMDICQISINIFINNIFTML